VLRDAVRGTPVTLKYRDAETSLLEGVFTRGDRRLGLAVEAAYRHGCRFDAWSEHLRFGVWMHVFAEFGIDPERYLNERSTDLEQPWDVIQSPVTKKFLVRDLERARRAGIIDDCRLEDVCFSCGVSDCPQRPWVKQPHAPIDLERAQRTVEAARYGRRKRPGAFSPLATPGSLARPAVPASDAPGAPRGIATSTRFRITFEKGAPMRFTSHLDLMRTWERTLRRSALPLAFTQGHHPHLKMSFGPPLPLGYRSRAEVFDLEFSQPPGVDLAERLNAVLPAGVSVSAFRPILFKPPSLMSELEGASYRVRFPGVFLTESGLTEADLRGALTARIPTLLHRDHVIVRRQSEAQTREFDARPSIVALEPGDEDGRTVLDAVIRFTARAQVRPDELVALLIPEADARGVDVERTRLWTERGGRRLDPLELLSART
jgi:radical SAM-linked protein